MRAEGRRDAAVDLRYALEQTLLAQYKPADGAALKATHRALLEGFVEPVVELSRLALDLLGYTADEVNSLTAADLVEDGVATALIEEIEAAEQGGRPSIRVTPRRKDGTPVWVEARLARADAGTNSSVFIALDPIRVSLCVGLLAAPVLEYLT